MYTSSHAGCNNDYDVILAIDSSGSIRNERYPQVLDFAASIVDEFEVSSTAARFGAVIFSDNDQVLFQLDRCVRHVAQLAVSTVAAGLIVLLKNGLITSNPTSCAVLATGRKKT